MLGSVGMLEEAVVGDAVCVSDACKLGGLGHQVKCSNNSLKLCSK